MISICITLRNRASLMRGKLEELCTLDYDPKQIEICVTDGFSTDGLKDVLLEYVDRFYCIRYALSDRNVLPFNIPSNNPACDINSQICNLASCEKIVRTDAEVRFTNRKTLKWIDSTLEDPEVCITFPCRRVNADYRWPEPIQEKHVIQLSKKGAFFCSAFNRSAFIRNGGVEEKFAMGFSGEDSYFHKWWEKNRVLLRAPMYHGVLHLYHGEVTTPANLKLRKKYSLPLYHYMRDNNISPNKDNPDWRRPEMLKDITIWGGSNV